MFQLNVVATSAIKSVENVLDVNNIFKGMSSIINATRGKATNHITNTYPYMTKFLMRNYFDILFLYLNSGKRRRSWRTQKYLLSNPILITNNSWYTQVI